MALQDPREKFGDIDIYLFDQLLRGRIAPGMKLLDAGCGRGRNLRYFLQAGYAVFGCDPSAEAIEAVRRMADELAPGASRDPGRYRVETLEQGTFDAASMDVVVCNAVLHFAPDREQFEAMLAGAWQPLRPGGTFFCRLASSIGIEERVAPLGRGRFALPDGSERYLVDEPQLIETTEAIGGRLLDPIKTTNVQGLRCMTTWVLTKI
jgi:tellurite methyltransferase